MSKTGIIILHWHNTTDVNEILRRLCGWDKSRYEIILVDNSQSFENTFGGVEVLRPAKNLGFSGGCNLGIQQAMATGCQFLLLLNADTAVVEQNINELVQIMESNSILGALSPVLLEMKNEKPTFHKGGKDPVRHSNTRIVVSSVTETSESPDYLPGTVLLLRSDAVKDIGLLDEDYFFSGEIADWFIRLKETNWKIDVSDNIVVEHFSSGNEAYRKKHYIYYSLRNRYLLIDKFGNGEKASLLNKWENHLRRQMLGAVLRLDFSKFIIIFRAIKDGRGGVFGQSTLMNDS